MNEFLLVFSWLAPLLAAPLSLHRRGAWLVPLAALPALLTAVTVPVGTHTEISWLLLGAHFGLDASARVFLLFTALLWLVAGLQAVLTMRGDPHWVRFQIFFLLAMAGNLWLIIGQDMVNFFLGFALMGLAAYGMVIHRGDLMSLRAGRVYLAMTIAAEVILFAALLFIFRHTETLLPQPAQLVGLSHWAIGLLVISLGIKAGLVLLHVWLPLAHPAAPVPASAVLSGTMIKAALIGWMRFLPLGHEALWSWGSLLITLGTLTVLYAIPVGLVQTNPKVVLAYSSVGKMGLMTAILGLALLEPTLTPIILTTLIFYAAHHGLAKGALFLGVGVIRVTTQGWLLLVLAIPALVLAGAPFTSGAMAKALVKPALHELGGLWTQVLPLVLLMSTIATTLLMARFLTLMQSSRHGAAHATLWIALPWLVLIGALLGMPYLTDYAFPSLVDSWPLVAGSSLALLALHLRPRWSLRLIGRIPAGDVLEPATHLARRLVYGLNSYLTTGYQSNNGFIDKSVPLVNTLRHNAAKLRSLEQNLRAWPIAGAATLSIVGVLLFLLWTTS